MRHAATKQRQAKSARAKGKIRYANQRGTPQIFGEQPEFFHFENILDRAAAIFESEQRKKARVDQQPRPQSPANAAAVAAARAHFGGSMRARKSTPKCARSRTAHDIPIKIIHANISCVSSSAATQPLLKT